MWKKIVLSFFAVMLSVYFLGIFYFSNHYYLNTTINGIPAGRKKPVYIYKQDKKNIKNYSIIIKELDDEEETLKGILMVSDIKYYNKVLNNQKSYTWPFHFIQDINLESNEMYQIDEDAFSEQIKEMKFVNEKKEPVNAKLEYDTDTKKYRIIPEELGSIKDKEETFQYIKEMALKKEKEADLYEYYKKPKIMSNSDSLLKAKEKLEKYLSTVIVYKRNNTEVTLNADTIHEFLCWNKKFKTWIDKKSIKSWVENHVSKNFNTVGQKRTIKSPGSGKFTVSGGSYGYIVSVDKETDYLLKAIKEGKQETKEPIYLLKGEIGNNYVDISLAEQKLWVVKDGKVVLSSPLVSGNTSTGHGTKTGVYFVEYKTTNYHMKKYNVHVDYWMPFDTSEGVGMHDATWRGSFGGSIYKSNGSHGCINLPHSKAGEIYHIVPVDYPVIVHW